MHDGSHQTRPNEVHMYKQSTLLQQEKTRKPHGKIHFQKIESWMKD